MRFGVKSWTFLSLPTFSPIFSFNYQKSKIQNNLIQIYFLLNEKHVLKLTLFGKGMWEKCVGGSASNFIWNSKQIKSKTCTPFFPINIIFTQKSNVKINLPTITEKHRQYKRKWPTKLAYGRERHWGIHTTLQKYAKCGKFLTT